MIIDGEFLRSRTSSIDQSKFMDFTSFKVKARKTCRLSTRGTGGRKVACETVFAVDKVVV